MPKKPTRKRRYHVPLTPEQIRLHAEMDKAWEDYRTEEAAVLKRIGEKRAREGNLPNGDGVTSGMSGATMVGFYLPFDAVAALEQLVFKLQKSVTRVSKSAVIEYLIVRTVEIDPSDYVRQVNASGLHRRTWTRRYVEGDTESAIRVLGKRLRKLTGENGEGEEDANV